ncbi:MAG: NAD+ synthase [Armatimonadota bacterium]|nr:NAD+ synthase [Armatimonadota bacterium]
MKLAIAQLDPVVGDIEGNLERLIEVAGRCHAQDTDLVVFPELYLVGYPPRDLLEKRWFIDHVEAAIAELRRASTKFAGTGVLFGAPTRTGRRVGAGLHNSALLVEDGELVAVRHKSLLPTYDVFDEHRYFDPAPQVRPVAYRGQVLGISICEDAWNAPELWPAQRLYDRQPVAELARQGATLMVNLSASPFYAEKDRVRYELISGHAAEHGVPFVYANQVGGNDELIFDGGSLLLDARGQVVERCRYFGEEIATVDSGADGDDGAYEPLEPIAAVHDALVLGISDYMRKCGFDRGVVGLSSGIDSSVTCALAARALGAAQVMGVTMPSMYSSEGSVTDSERLAGNLGIRFEEIAIADIYRACIEELRLLIPPPPSTTEENIQARIRGNILMAISNEHGHIVLSTGNKSELAVGYCTLYGDMSGGLAVLADVPKMMVYELAEYINRDGEIIPQAVIEKVPSAELRPNQTDQDTLPPYEVLDTILELYIEEGLSLPEIIAEGFEPETVRWVVNAVNGNEYKRRQAAPGLKVTTKAFGTGRRMPIAARYEACIPARR